MTRLIRYVRFELLTKDALRTLVVVFIHCRLDYCNALLHGWNSGHPDETVAVCAECCGSSSIRSSTLRSCGRRILSYRSHANATQPPLASGAAGGRAALVCTCIFAGALRLCEKCLRLSTATSCVDICQDYTTYINRIAEFRFLWTNCVHGTQWQRQLFLESRP